MSAVSETVLAILQQRIEAADAQGFALLRRIPSTTAWRYLGYIESLPPDERRELMGTCATIAHQMMMPMLGYAVPAVSPQDAGQQPQAILFQKVFSQPRLNASPDRFLRQFPASMLKEMMSEERMQEIMALPLPVTATAGAVRKELRRQMKEAFDADITNQGGGEWSYVGCIEDVEFYLHMDYGVMGPGFRYGVGFRQADSSGPYESGGTLEASYGIQSGNCDFPVADELTELAQTLTEVIKDLAQLYVSIKTATGNLNENGPPG